MKLPQRLLCLLLIVQLVTLVALSAGCTHSNRNEEISPQSLQPGPIRHAQLTDSQMTRIHQLQETFADVDPSPFDSWVEDFKRDEDPEREIGTYEDMASAYRLYCSGKTLTLAAKLDVYRIVLRRSMVPEAKVLPGLPLKALSPDEARAVLKLYTAPPAPVIITRNPS